MDVVVNAQIFLICWHWL